MTESGKVIYIGLERSGVSTRTGNPWKSVEFVIETDESYPRRIAFTLFGEQNIIAANLKIGERIDVVGFVESHEYNGNWYTECRAKDICQGGMSRLSQTTLSFNAPQMS